jgi:adenylate kinase family enzyme
LKAYYSKMELLEKIDGNGNTEEVFQDIASHLNSMGV